jgi:hypothetical protein
VALSACTQKPSNDFPRAPGQFAVSDLVIRDFNARFPAQNEVNGESIVIEVGLSLEDVSRSECMDKTKCQFANVVKLSSFYDGEVVFESQLKQYFNQAGQLERFSVKDSDGIDSVCERVGSVPTPLYAYVGETGREPDFKCDNQRATKEYGLNGGSRWSMQEGTNSNSATLVYEDDGSITRWHLDQYNTVRGIELSLNDKENNSYISGSWQP